MLVYTTRGLIEHEKLVVTDIIELHEGVRVTATEWHLDGELVRRDVNVNVLVGQAVAGEQGKI